MKIFFFEVTSPYQAPNFEPGRYQVIVRTSDKAGNIKDESVTVNVVTAISRYIDREGINLIFAFVPWSYILLAVLLLLLLVFIIIARLWIKHHHHLRHAFREDIKAIFRIGRGPQTPVQ